MITASLGITDLEDISPDETGRITEAHLLLCMYNAWQPGVFALSGWDLVGALPLERSQVRSLIRDGDTRWIERGAYDLMDAAPDAAKSASGMPRATALYGSLPQQLGRPDSFARRLARILEVRKRAGLATGALVDVPEVPNRCMLVLVNQLVDDTTQVTVLNFSEEALSARVQSEHIPAGRVVDLANLRPVGTVDDLGGFTVELPPFGGLALAVREPEPDEE